MVQRVSAQSCGTCRVCHIHLRLVSIKLDFNADQQTCSNSSGLYCRMSSDDEAPMVAAAAVVEGGAGDDGEGLASTPKLPDGESGSDDGREVNFDQSDEEDNTQSKKARSGATEKRVKSSPGGPSKPSKRQNEEREARDEFVKRLASEMHAALVKDTKAREEHRPAFEMLKMLPRVCEAVANPLLFNYWRDDSAHMNLLADWIAPHSRSVNLPILTKLLPAIEQLPLEKDVSPMPPHVNADVYEAELHFCDASNRISATITGFQRACRTSRPW
jgi:hypothetical protein